MLRRRLWWICGKWRCCRDAWLTLVVNCGNLHPVEVITMIKVADEAWVALALMHREHEERASFRVKEVVERCRQEKISPILRPGVQVHLYKHAVANIAPSTGRYRMFF